MKIAKVALITGITGQDGSYLAEFLLDNAANGNEILAVLEDIVEVTESGGTDL